MRSLPLLALFLAVPAAAQQGGAPFTVAETGQGYGRLDDAVKSIGGGSGTILIAPGIYRECTSQSEGVVTFRAVRPGTAIFDGVTCEGKAALVLGGNGSVVEGLVFRNMRVGDGNGAGIRSESGDLVVRDATFLDSQEGILGGQDGAQKISIDHSTFAGLGQCDETPDCAHSIYLTNKGRVTITNSRFERGRGGHYVKLRSPQVSITNSSFDDTAGTKTNYMIDLPNGATGLIAGNTFVQGKNKENWTGFIVVAAEAHDYSSAGLRIEGNTASLAPGVTHSPAFVADGSKERLAVGANRLGQNVRMYETR